MITPKIIREVLCIYLLVGLIIPIMAYADPLVITYRSPESDKDTRYIYDNLLLKMALDKTISEYGSYQLRPSNKMNTIRTIRTIKNNLEVNFFAKLSYEEYFSRENMIYVKFPVDLGIVGYRICFVSPERFDEVSLMTSLTELKTLTHGQGVGWSDISILRHNGFTVKTVNNYKSLFPMVAKNRFDIFCRGANELHEEYETNKKIQGLMYNKTIAFYYPLPRFFYTHPSNKLAMERITKGIMLAFYDGSLKKLWLKHYQKNVDFADLDNRKVFNLENPFVNNINFNFKKYMYAPFIEY